MTQYPVLLSATIALGAFVVLYAWLLATKRLRRFHILHFADKRRERLFLASLGFLAGFVIVRLITHAIRAGRGPFHNIGSNGLHVHHLVWGIFLLLATGYGWLWHGGDARGGRALARVLALMYGVGAALTLDEFALWLHLRDVYWEHQGRASLNAVAIFGTLVSIGLWGGPFLRAVGLEVGRAIRPRVPR